MMNGKSESELGKSLMLTGGPKSMLMLVGPAVKLRGGGRSFPGLNPSPPPLPQLPAGLVICVKCVGREDPVLAIEEGDDMVLVVGIPIADVVNEDGMVNMRGEEWAVKCWEVEMAEVPSGVTDITGRVMTALVLLTADVILLAICVGSWAALAGSSVK